MVQKVICNFTLRWFIKFNASLLFYHQLENTFIFAACKPLNASPLLMRIPVNEDSSSKVSQCNIIGTVRHAVQLETNVTKSCVSLFSLADVRAMGKRSKLAGVLAVFNRMCGTEV